MIFFIHIGLFSVSLVPVICLLYMPTCPPVNKLFTKYNAGPLMYLTVWNCVYLYTFARKSMTTTTTML
ncbi:hypothetical protein M0802_012755 [Mischocyttarus mexicanus]|nr:hypothetical protein M0802_012770 [Mischocyttarus mexicanus]KAI4485537.1 hypothetical protein M0802_012755 [Mischocyttarus mexicanus]